MRRNGLVKTVRFGDGKYVGDPLNAVRIFNEKEVDELMVLDIDATASGAEPDYALIANLASECRMPMSYGGGVTRVDQAARIISLGVEKVAVSAAAIARPSLVSEMADAVGTQSVTVVLDVRKHPASGGYRVCTHNGTRDTGADPAALSRRFEASGAGEVVINAIDRDGVMEGYDIALVRRVRDSVSIPLTVLGGAGSLRDIQELIREFGPIGAAAGSLFVFKGVYRAVLINYPNRQQKHALFSGSQEAVAS